MVQSHLQALTEDRNHLQLDILFQRTKYTARVARLKSRISQMKKEEEMVRRLQAARLNFMVNSNEREALLYKKQLELAESDLEDFCACVEILGLEILQLKEKLNSSGADKGDSGIDDSKEQHIVALEEEIKKMKHEHKKVILKKDSEISALVEEKDFMWSQFKRRYDEYNDLLKTKQMEGDRYSETIQMLQLSTGEKDEAMARLAAERYTLETDVGRLTQEAEGAKERIEDLQLQLDKLQLLGKEKDETVASLRRELASPEMSLTRSTRGRSSESSNSELGSRNDSATLGDNHPRKRSRKLRLPDREGSLSQKLRLVHKSSSGFQATGSGSVIRKIRSSSRSSSLVQRLPERLRPFILKVNNVCADGNCGYRAIAALMGFGEQEWVKVRGDLFVELSMHEEYYTNLFGGHQSVDGLKRALEYYKSGPAPFATWMIMPDMGHLIASAYNVVLFYLSVDQSLTFLPLQSPALDVHLRKEIVIGLVNRNHFIEVLCCKDHPVPPITTDWAKHHLPIAHGWATPYKARIQLFRELIGRSITTFETIVLDDT